MTNAEAITALEMMQAQIEWDYPMENAVAIDMAIEAIKEKEKMGDNEVLRKIAKHMEEKLKELMGEKEYALWSAETAKKAFREEVQGMEDGDFKDFILTNFDEIVGGGK